MSGHRGISGISGISSISSISAARRFSSDITTQKQACAARFGVARGCFRLCGGTPERTT